MTDLNEKLNGMKKKYREIFVKSVDAIIERVENIRPDGFEGDIFDNYAENSTGKKWQKSVLDMLENDISKEILAKWTELIEYRKNFE